MASYRRALELKPQNRRCAVRKCSIRRRDRRKTFSVSSSRCRDAAQKPASGESGRYGAVLLDQKVVRIPTVCPRNTTSASSRSWTKTEAAEIRRGRRQLHTGYAVGAGQDREGDSSKRRSGRERLTRAKATHQSLGMDSLRPVRAHDSLLTACVPAMCLSSNTCDPTWDGNLFSDYFGDVRYARRHSGAGSALCADAAGRRSATAAVLQSASVPRDATLERTDETRGKDPSRAVARNLPMIPDDAGRPGCRAVGLYPCLDTLPRPGEDVAVWYRGLIAESLAPSADISRAAQAVVAHIPPSDELGRIRALYNEVVRRTRYVGLEFGIHGYQPQGPFAGLGNASLATAKTKRRCSTSCSKGRDR